MCWKQVSRFSWVLGMALGLGGCVTAYQPLGWNGGYTEMRLNEDTYQVSFVGNNSTPQLTVNRFLLRRAAQVTLNSGYQYFIVLNQSEQKKVDHFTTGGHAYTTGQKTQTSGNSESFEKQTYFDPPVQQTLTAYTDNMTVQMLKTNQGHPDAYDANMVLSNFAGNN